MELNYNTIERLYEISFFRLMDNIKANVGNEKVDYLLEQLCIVFKIDFTSMSILKNMYLHKIKATKRELSIYCNLTKMPIDKLPIDYRTYRKYINEWRRNGSVNLNPLVVNAFLKPVIKDFVDKYTNLIFDELNYIRNLTTLIGEINNVH